MYTAQYCQSNSERHPRSALTVVRDQDVLLERLPVEIVDGLRATPKRAAGHDRRGHDAVSDLGECKTFDRGRFLGRKQRWNDDDTNRLEDVARCSIVRLVM